MIGDLDRRIIIQNYTSSVDAHGQPIQTWTNFATVWAGVNFKGGSEGFMAEKLTATADLTFTIRYITGIDEKSRIVYNSVNYDIQTIAEVDRKRYLEISAKKTV